MSRKSIAVALVPNEHCGINRQQLRRRRLKFINQGIRLGVIKRIEMTSGFTGSQIADVWIRAPFYTLTYDQKEALAATIYEYHFSDDSTSLMFTDSMSGNIVGTFKPSLGLQMK